MRVIFVQNAAVGGIKGRIVLYVPADCKRLFKTRLRQRRCRPASDPCLLYTTSCATLCLESILVTREDWQWNSVFPVQTTRSTSLLPSSSRLPEASTSRRS